MNQIFYSSPGSFSTRKVSVQQAIRILSKNGIQVNKEKAAVILDFLYLIARTYKSKNDRSVRDESNT